MLRDGNGDLLTSTDKISHASWLWILGQKFESRPVRLKSLYVSVEHHQRSWWMYFHFDFVSYYKRRASRDPIRTKIWDGSSSNDVNTWVAGETIYSIETAAKWNLLISTSLHRLLQHFLISYVHFRIVPVPQWPQRLACRPRGCRHAGLCRCHIAPLYAWQSGLTPCGNSRRGWRMDRKGWVCRIGFLMPGRAWDGMRRTSSTNCANRIILMLYITMMVRMNGTLNSFHFGFHNAAQDATVVPYAESNRAISSSTTFHTERARHFLAVVRRLTPSRIAFRTRWSRQVSSRSSQHAFLSRKRSGKRIGTNGFKNMRKFPPEVLLQAWCIVP